MHKTKKQIAEQRRRWLDNANRSRKARYHSDPAYRAAIQVRSREAGRGTGLHRDRLAVCLQSLAQIESYGRVRRLIGVKSKTPVEIRCFTASELAPLLGLSQVVMLYQWHRTGKLPRGKLRAQVSRTYAPVYSLDEVRRVLAVWIEHLRVKAYLLATDTETIRKLNACIGG